MVSKLKAMLTEKNNINYLSGQPIPTQTLSRERIIITISMVISLTLGFYITDQYMAMQLLKSKSFWSPALAWDHMIPFGPNWIWIYLLYFPACFLPITFKELWEDIGIFRRTALGFIIQFVIALIIFWIFPSRMERPNFQPAEISEYVLLWFYRIDPGFNIFPSLHVANVAYIACVAWRLQRPFLSIATWIFCALIAVSTLFVKQHYIVDLLAGVLIGTAGYLMSFANVRVLGGKS